MTWYLIQTKPQQEFIAEKNLKNQGYESYLPLVSQEKVIQKRIEVKVLPLFPRYLFVKLKNDFSSKSWMPIRSTKGVSNIVRFGMTLASASDQLIEILKSREFQHTTNIQPLYRKGQVLKIIQGPFAGFESIYCGMDDQMRVIVLFEFMKKTTSKSFNFEEISLLA